MSKKQLPERQKKVYDFIIYYVQENGFPPTVREIGEAIDVSSTSLVSYYLKRLEERGLIERESSMSRAIRLNDETVLERAVPGDAAVVPLQVNGYIAAGEPIMFGDFTRDESEAIELTSDLVGRDTSKLFALRVQGNSMIDAFINDGDIVVLQQQPMVSNGQLAAVWIKSREETTLKRFFHEGQRVRLQPENQEMSPIFVRAEDVEVQGKVVLVIRRLE